MAQDSTSNFPTAGQRLVRTVLLVQRRIGKDKNSDFYLGIWNAILWTGDRPKVQAGAIAREELQSSLT